MYLVNDEKIHFGYAWLWFGYFKNTDGYFAIFKYLWKSQE
jgi:hypothetical protein